MGVRAAAGAGVFAGVVVGNAGGIKPQAKRARATTATMVKAWFIFISFSLPLRYEANRPTLSAGVSPLMRQLYNQSNRLATKKSSRQTTGGFH
jgi:hypothetical protein